MTESLPSYQGIKVNLITGFLGAGKTTLIKHLLTQIPKGESWAVLVNEFGEIGLDQTLLETSLTSDKYKALSEQVAIKQVAGGCVCCATSAAFQVTLNALIKAQNPDRIIIEPTGLGHPHNILKQLNGPHYQGVLDIEPSVCLLDARNLGDERYTLHPNFIEQVAMADILVASKSETYQTDDWQAFERYLEALKPAKTRVEKIANGQLSLSQISLDLAESDLHTILDKSEKSFEHSQHNHSHHDHKSLSEKKTLSNLDAHNQEDFYLKVSDDGLNMAWKFPQTIAFDQALLESVLEELNGMESILRMKGVFNLDSGALLLNATKRDFSLYANEKKQTESKFELILSADSEVLNQDQIQSWVLSLL
ncbi:MAG: CobW family GTP-binding protein [Marinomonas sp.]